MDQAPRRLQSRIAKQVAQVVYPDTPAGDRARRWFQAMASGKPEVLRAYFEDNSYTGGDPYDPARDVMMYGMVHRNAGGVSPYSVLRSDHLEIVMLAAGGNGTWLRLTLGVRAEEPYLVTALGVRRSAVRSMSGGTMYGSAAIRCASAMLVFTGCAHL